LPTATIDRQNNISQVDISMNSLTENVNSPEDLVLQPFDVIRVEASEVVYVNGEVGKIGGIPLGERESLSITQAVAIAGGLGKDADPEKCRILRPVLDTSRRAEIPVNVKRIMEGKATDFPLMPNDVLYVPRSGGISKHIGTIALIAIPIIPTILVLALR
jgi:polysaccharide export outer membrane protein